MKSAPNLKKQPKDPFAEVLIFAGADAWMYAADWQEGNKARDIVPPVVLDKNQLAQIDRLRIVDENRRCVRVCRAGELSQKEITGIATKLALAGVLEARLYSEAHELIEDWSSRLQTLREEAERGEGMAVQLKVITGGRSAGANLSQMAASQRGELLAEHYGQIAVNAESGAVYRYNGAIWQRVADSELRRALVALFNRHETPFSPVGIENAIAAMKLQIPEVGEQPRQLIGFANGVYDMRASQFRPHDAEDWLQNHNGIEFTQPEAGENLQTHAPHFYRWLSHAAGQDAAKASRIKAALFMVLANRYDWQMFLEITGEGGSGKSVFTHIATLLAGEHNTASGSMRTLDEARGRAQFVGKSLITLPDQVKYVGEGAGIKAITGGDLVEIDGKYEKQFSTVLQAVVLATNNEPMAFTERNGGIARRRVIFPFNHPVDEAHRDPDLPQKISRELPVLIRHLLAEFTDQENARALMLAQRDSPEALEVKRGTDPVIDLCAALYFMEEARGLMMGGGESTMPEPRTYLYHLYLAFMAYQGLGRPLAVGNFGKAMKNAAREHGKEYKTRTIKGRRQTNVQIAEQADEFLPRAYGCEIPDPPTSKD